MLVDRSAHVRHHCSNWGFGAYLGCLVSVVGAVLGTVRLLGLQAGSDPPAQVMNPAAALPQDTGVRTEIVAVLDSLLPLGLPEGKSAVASAPVPQEQIPPSHERPGLDLALQSPVEVPVEQQLGGQASRACGALRGDFMRDILRQTEGSSRQDGRCGSGYPSSRPPAAQCPPVGGLGPCCSAGGWCGGARLHCKSNVTNFRSGWQLAGNLPQS